jgi:hypothetical protein
MLQGSKAAARTAARHQQARVCCVCAPARVAAPRPVRPCRVAIMDSPVPLHQGQQGLLGQLLAPNMQPPQERASAPAQQPAARSAAKPELCLSWAGSGAFFWWQLGAVQYLRQRYDLTNVRGPARLRPVRKPGRGLPGTNAALCCCPSCRAAAGPGCDRQLLTRPPARLCAGPHGRHKRRCPGGHLCRLRR